MKKVKLIVKLVVFAAIAAALFFLAKPAFADGQAFALTWTQVGKILFMVFCTLAAEYLILLILSFFTPKNHRVRTAFSLTANLIRYIAVIVILIGVLTLAQVDMTAILAGLGVVALIVGFAAESLITDVVTGFFILMDISSRSAASAARSPRSASAPPA